MKILSTNYRTYTRGKGWLPYVTSLENDYAGLPNMAMEALQIRVSDNNGNFLDSNYVVMYRTCNNGKWLPWVSNANPTIMNNIKSRYKLPGTLDTASGDAGLPGSGHNVTAIEIRIYEGETSDSVGNGSGGYTSNTQSARILIGNTWKTLTADTHESRIDGIELKTSSNKPYKLHYRTYTRGKGWLPYVTSLENDYAGLPNMAMEALQIRVSDNNGNFLDSNYVVMYRTYNNGNWLPWVSNAKPEIMNNIKSKYNLPGTLDTNSGDAGLPGSGSNVNAIEVRIFEGETSGSTGVDFGGGSNTQSARILIGNTWKTLTADTHESRIDGIELKTSSSKPYKLHYRTYTRGKGWLPYVTSLENDYAGLPNMAMEALQIRVSDNNGNFLDSNYVVMYRTYNNGNWLPWVSNANPTIMNNIKSKYNLSGTLDTASGNAGLPGSGSNVNAIEIRVYEGEFAGSTGGSNGGSSGAESFRYLVGNTWKTLTSSTFESRIDGVEIKTSSSKPYKLHYRTYTTGKGWLPYVTSLQNDYAGLPNMAMEALQIRVSDNNGNFLDSNYVVMYRTYNKGRWLPWVSNAEPTIMYNIQSKYNLPGTLDTASGDAGLPGSGVPVNAIEIRIFEGETSGSTGSSTGETPIGNVKTIYIDPGHGGSDPGACANGLREKDLNLKISQYQAQYFREAGYNVVLSRNSDTFVELIDRSAEANRLNADLYINNHINAYASPNGAYGSEVYCSRVGGIGRNIAQAVSNALGKTFYNRGVKVKLGSDGRDYYHVIRETKMPAILIEQGFINHSGDAAILSSDANLKKIAKDTVDAIKGIVPYSNTSENDITVNIPPSVPANVTISPSIYIKSQWGAAQSVDAGTATQKLKVIPNYILVHHSANAQTINNDFEEMRDTQLKHINKGYGDIGYHYCVGREGSVMKGRSLDIIGAHCADNNKNRDAIGVCCFGNFEANDTFTSKQYSNLISLLSRLCQEYKIDPSNIRGHKDFSNTACPGKNIYSKINQIRSEVKSKVGSFDQQKIMSIDCKGYYNNTWYPLTERVYNPCHVGNCIHPLQGIYLCSSNLPNGYKTRYRVYVSNKGWLPWVNNFDDYAGIIGYNIESIEIKVVNQFNEDVSERYTYVYRSFIESNGWSCWSIGNNKMRNDISFISRIARCRSEINSISKTKSYTGLPGSGKKILALQLYLFNNN